MNNGKSDMNLFVRILSVIFSFFIPVVGTAMWFFYRNRDKKWARIYLVLSILGFFANYFTADWLENYTGINLG